MKVVIPRHIRLSSKGKTGQPQKENRVSLNDLVERKYPFYEVILIKEIREKKP